MSSPQDIRTLADYLRQATEHGVIDFALRCHTKPDGSVEFYIHPLNKSGVTADFTTKGDQINLRNPACGVWE